MKEISRSFLFAGFLALAVAAQQPAHEQHHPPTSGSTTAQSQVQPAMPSGQNMPAMCRQAMAQQQMMADMKAANERLNKMVAQMNVARGDAKVRAMSDVITEMVAQREKMLQHMANMRQNMMGHMAAHMPGAGSTMQCPMMQQQSTKPQAP